MYDSIRPGQVWLDTKGERIQAHGGSVMYLDGTYYWYDQSNVDKWKTIKDTLLRPTFYDSGAFDLIVLPTDSLLPAIKTSCDDIAMTALANAIYAATEEEAVAIMEKCREELIDSGIEELAEFYTEQYKATAEKWGL